MKKGYMSVLITILILFFALIPALYAEWLENGTPICTAAEDQDECQIIPGIAGGSIIAWEDSRSIMGGGIFAQVINERGTRLGPSNGRAIQTDLAGGLDPQLATDGAGGAVITWYDGRNMTNWKVFARRIDANGNALWTDDGVELCTGSADQEYPYIVATGAGECIVAWEHGPTGSEDIRAQMVDTSGVVQWPSSGVAICTAGGRQSWPRLVSDAVGGAIIVWTDEHGGAHDVYAQRVNAQGTVRWATNGVAICTAPYSQYRPDVTTDGEGGAIVTWNDRRMYTYEQVYAQRIDSTGTVRWPANGIVVDTLAIRGWPVITSDGSGGAIVAWDRGENIFAQRIDANGNALWTLNGVAVSTAAGTQELPQITTDGLGGAIIAWEDGPAGDDDIYAARVDANGTVRWTPNGVAVCTAADYQRHVRIASDGVGGAIIIWEDGRSGADDVYAARVDANGTIVPTLLKFYSASTDESAVTITWHVSEIGDDMDFFVLRAEGTAELFEGIIAPKIDADGYSFSFRDDSIDPGKSYRYRVEVSGEIGRRLLFETEPVSIPVMALTLYQNHPNPFNPTTTISFTVPENMHANLSIFDTAGELVKTLVNEAVDEGFAEVPWDGKDNRGNTVSSGVYLYRLKAGKKVMTRKMVLLK